MTHTAPVSEIPVLPQGASNKERVEWAFSVINTHDVDPLKEQLWKTVVEYLPGITLHGSDDVVGYFSEIFGAVPDFHMDVKCVAEDGENVLVRWVATGHFTGSDFQGLKATGARIEFTGFDHFVFRDGELVTNDVAYDRLLFAQQIGLLPADDSFLDRTMKGAFNLKTQIVSRLSKR